MFERIWPSVFEKETLRIWFFAGMWYLLCMSVFILPKPGSSAGIAHLKSAAPLAVRTKMSTISFTWKIPCFRAETGAKTILFGRMEKHAIYRRIYLLKFQVPGRLLI